MKKVLCIILCMVLVCGLFASCSVEEKSLVSDKSSTAELSNSEFSAPTVTEKIFEDGTYTLMIYMCGSDLETKSGAATKNIAEMLSAAENNAVCEAVANCVKSVSGEYRKDAKGLSVYYPLNSVKSVQDYLAISDDENYKAFLKKNYSDTSGGEIFIINGGSEDNGKLKVQINTDTVKNVIKTTYRLYRIVSVGENHEVVYGMGEDTDVFFDGANGYTAEFEGFWVTFNGYYINCSVETDSEQYTEFSSPAKINGVLSEICFVYDKEKKQIKLQGYCTVDSETNVVGRLTDFSVGDKIMLLYDDRTEYEKNLIEGDSFTFSDSTEPRRRIGALIPA